MKAINRSKSNWTPQMIKRLGTATDASLGDEWGIPMQTVAHCRIRRCIPAFQAQKPWTDDQIALLGTMSDRKVAAIVGRSRGAVMSARVHYKIQGIPGTAPNTHWREIELAFRFGTASMTQIAAQYGVATAVLSRKAKKLGWTRGDLARKPDPHAQMDLLGSDA